MSRVELRTDDFEHERPLFEAWYSEGGKFPHATERGSGGEYLLQQAHTSWSGWKARAALCASPTAGVPDAQSFQAAFLTKRVWDLAAELEALIAATPLASGQLNAAARDVLAERRRQVEAEQWTPEHDDRYRHGQLAMAAACYAAAVPMDNVLHGDGVQIENVKPAMPSAWPWASAWWKPRSARRNLVRAGALVLAEIERLDRATATGLPVGRPSEAEESQP